MKVTVSYSSSHAENENTHENIQSAALSFSYFLTMARGPHMSQCSCAAERSKQHHCAGGNAGHEVFTSAEPPHEKGRRKANDSRIHRFGKDHGQTERF